MRLCSNIESALMVEVRVLNSHTHAKEQFREFLAGGMN